MNEFRELYSGFKFRRARGREEQLQHIYDKESNNHDASKKVDIEGIAEDLEDLKEETDRRHRIWMIYVRKIWGKEAVFRELGDCKDYHERRYYARKGFIPLEEGEKILESINVRENYDQFGESWRNNSD